MNLFFLQNEFLGKISLCNTHEIASLSENPVFSIGVNLHKTELNVIIIPQFIIFLNRIGAEIDAEVFINDN